MVDQWIRGAEVLVDARQAYAKANGLSPRVGAPYRAPDTPWRLVWHTMEAPEDDPATPTDEGWDLDQARSYIVRHRTPPHLWALPLHDHVFQTVPLDKAAYALRHEAGDPETNHAHAIQVEVLGYAKDGLDGDVCDWLGERVLRPVLDAGVPIDVSVVASSTGAAGYGLNGAVRMTWGQWRAFRGVCGHANVPGNSHWDPGVADYHRITRAAAPSPTLTEDDDMPATYRIEHQGRVAYVLPDGTICDQDIDGQPMVEGSRGDDAMRAVYVARVANAVQVDRAQVVVRLGQAVRDSDVALLQKLTQTVGAIGMYTAALAQIEGREEQRDLAAPGGPPAG